jgi:hypothetical protein
MTTKTLTILIVGAVLAGSAAAALQATDASPVPAVSARTACATSVGARVFAVVPPAGRFAASAGGLAQGAHWIVVLTPRPPSAGD